MSIGSHTEATQASRCLFTNRAAEAFKLSSLGKSDSGTYLRNKVELMYSDRPSIELPETAQCFNCRSKTPFTLADGRSGIVLSNASSDICLEHVKSFGAIDVARGLSDACGSCKTHFTCQPLGFKRRVKSKMHVPEPH